MNAAKEYQIRPVTRYVVTEFTPAIDNGKTGSAATSKVIGEFANEQIAGTVWAAFTQNAMTERDYPLPPTETPFPG